MHNNGGWLPSPPTGQIFWGYILHPLGIYAYALNWPINHPFQSKISFLCVQMGNPSLNAELSFPIYLKL